MYMKNLAVVPAFLSAVILISCSSNSQKAETLKTESVLLTDSSNTAKDADEETNKVAEHKDAAPAGHAEGVHEKKGELQTVSTDKNSNATASSKSGTVESKPTATTPTTETKKKGMSHTAKGAIVGGVAGAVTGAVINKKEPVKGAVIGTVVGAGVGAGTGIIVDKSVKKKQEAAAKQ